MSRFSRARSIHSHATDVMTSLQSGRSPSSHFWTAKTWSQLGFEVWTHDLASRFCRRILSRNSIGAEGNPQKKQKQANNNHIACLQYSRICDFLPVIQDSDLLGQASEKSPMVNVGNALDFIHNLVRIVGGSVIPFTMDVSRPLNQLLGCNSLTMASTVTLQKEDVVQNGRGIRG